MIAEAIEARLQAIEANPEALGNILTPTALALVQEAAARQGETPAQFLMRAIQGQIARDDFNRDAAPTQGTDEE